MASPLSSIHNSKYDVFLSFRGEDTRYSFTDHLYKALLDAGLRTFRGNYAIQLGHNMKPEIKDAIIGSRASIVVLSENYASSRWCLEELWLILNQRRNFNHLVLPVFYHVDPSAVKEGRSFAIQGSNWTVDNVRRWNAALREVADLKGMVLSGYKTFETDFIKEVVETVDDQLSLKQLSTPAHLPKMEMVNSQLYLKQLSTPADLTEIETVNNQLVLKQLSTFTHLTGMETVNSQRDLKTMPFRSSMSSLEVIDLSHVGMEKFEIPVVLNSLKKLCLKECHKLVSICSLYRLPKLEKLLLCKCSSLTHICKSIEDLESLVLLDLNGCAKLLKASSNQKNVKTNPKHPRIDGGDPEQPLFSLPCSLKSLYLDLCKIEYSSDVRVAFHAQSFISLCLGCNFFEFLPNWIELKMLRTLDLSSCAFLMSLPRIPSTLEELHIEWCGSLERITFESGRFSLRQFSYEGCFQLSEVQGLFKLVPIAKIGVKELGDMQRIKAYRYHRVDLVGDDITKGKVWHTQVLYEYGIMSTYLQGIKDKNMMTYEYMSSSAVLSFCVHFHPEQNRIQGLNVSCLYRSLVSTDKDGWLLLAKISDKTKGLTWVYNPVVYCKPRVDEDVVWLSYWPIGNILDAGDEVRVDIIVDDGVIVSKCGASLVYRDDEDGQVEEEENSEINIFKEQEVIGGDLTEFEVTRGGYYLCRRDMFGPETSSRLKVLFDDNIDYPESHGWRKTCQSRMRNYRTGMGLSLYDVFLSSRGEDTYTLTDHLYRALVQAGISTFRYEVAIEKGQEVKPEIKAVIIQSRASIVVLSADYVRSGWCLNELWLIMEQNRKCDHFVLPVFYDVEPTTIRNHAESFAIEDSHGTVVDVKRWKAALTEVAKLDGMVVSRSEAYKDFIASVIDTVNHELWIKILSDHRYHGI